MNGKDIKHLQFTEFSEGHGSIYGTLKDGSSFKLHITEIMKMLDEFEFKVEDMPNSKSLDKWLRVDWDASGKVDKVNDLEYERNGAIPNKVNYVVREDNRFIEYRIGNYISGDLKVIKPKEVAKLASASVYVNKPKTIFCDLDGTLVEHSHPVDVQKPDLELQVLPGVHDKLTEWDTKGYYIVITTGRKESAREATVKQMQRAGIIYDELIMGFGGGDRILINDRKPDGRTTAYSINLERNKGIEDVEL